MNKGIIMEEIVKTLQKAFQQFDSVRLIRCGLVLLVTIIVLIAGRIIFNRIKKKFNLTEDLKKKHTATTIYRIVKVLIIFGAVLVMMQVCGVNINSIVMGLGLLTALLAFAVKDVFQDLFAGFIIITDKFFKVGDAVEYEGREGIVTYFTIRSTKIECLDDRSVLSVANRNISQIRRLTHLVDVDLPLSYEEDMKTVYQTLESICERIRGIEGVEDCVLKGTQQFADSAVIYKIRFFCEPNDRPDIRRAVLKTIQEGLDEAGIHIPYQQIDIHEK